MHDQTQSARYCTVRANAMRGVQYTVRQDVLQPLLIVFLPAFLCPALTLSVVSLPSANFAPMQAKEKPLKLNKEDPHSNSKTRTRSHTPSSHPQTKDKPLHRPFSFHPTPLRHQITFVPLRKLVATQKNIMATAPTLPPSWNIFFLQTRPPRA